MKRFVALLVALSLAAGCASEPAAKPAPAPPPPPPLCDAARYPDHKLPLDKALGGGEVTAGPFIFCLLAYADPEIKAADAQVDVAHMGDLPGVGWTALWAYDGPEGSTKLTVEAGPLPEVLQPLGAPPELKPGQTGGLDAGGLPVSNFPDAGGRRQAGIRVQTADGTYGARLSFRVEGATVTNISVLPWDESAYWQPITAIPSPNGKALAISKGNSFSMVDANGRAAFGSHMGHPLGTMVWSPSGQLVLVQSDDDPPLLVQDGDRPPRPLGLKAGPLYAAFSPDETRLLLGKAWPEAHDPSWTCPVWLYNLTDGSLTELGTFERLEGVEWQGNQDALIHIYDGGGHSKLELRRVDTWEKLREVPRGTLSPDRKTLVADPGQGALLKLTNLVTGEERTLWKDIPPGAPPGAYTLGVVVFAPDSRRFAYSAYERWDAPQLLYIATGDGDSQLVSDHQAGWMAWAPTGELLYAEKAGGDLKIKLGAKAIGTIPGGKTLGLPYNVGVTGHAVWHSDGNRGATVISHEDGSLQLAVVQIREGLVKEAGPDLTPLMWAGDKLLALEMPAFHHATTSGRAYKAVWLIDPQTGERTQVE